MTSQDPLEENIAMGKRIAQRREEGGMTQKQLADRAGISVTFLSEVENGKRNISMGKLCRLLTNWTPRRIISPRHPFGADPESLTSSP